MSKLDGYTVDEVLEWVNAERKARSYGPPLAKIPKGVPKVCCHCPIARALNNSIVTDDSWYPVENWNMSSSQPLPLPDYVRLFILDMDSDEYPELVVYNVGY